jgi:Rhomboid family
LGASGVCFAFILLNSLVSAKRGKLPLSFVLTAIWWLGDELIDFFFSGDGVSHHAHLVGGIVGAAFGYYLRQETPTSGDGVTASAQGPTKTQAGAIANQFKSIFGAIGGGGEVVARNKIDPFIDVDELNFETTSNSHHSECVMKIAVRHTHRDRTQKRVSMIRCRCDPIVMAVPVRGHYDRTRY